MRLTLRTMLAYLDEQLEPPQMEEIGQKIRESGVAEGMIDRIRTSVKKHRMEAPKLDSRGIGKDANSVAEYLDNVLDKDEIAELEQLCLNSDMHLSEVAACHQILSMLPNVELDFDSELRDRIYELAHHRNGHDAPRNLNGAGAVKDAVRPRQAEVKGPSSGDKKRKKKKTPQVPEYFKKPQDDSRKWLPLLLTAIVLLVGLGVGLFATRDQWLKNFSRQTAASNSLNDPATTNTPSENQSKAANKNDVAAKTADKEASEGETAASAKKPPRSPNGKDASEDSIEEAPAKEIPIPREGIASEGPPLPPPAEKESETKEVVDDRDSKIAPPVPREDEGKPPATEMAPSPKGVAGSPAVAWDMTNKGWRRVAMGDSLPWEGVVQLVGTRMELQSASGLTATLVGPSELRFEKDARDRELIWIMDAGRMVLDAKEAGGATLKAQFAGRSVEIKFVSPDCQIAVEVVRQTPAGSDPASPEEFPAKVFIDFLRGAAEIKSGEFAQVMEAGAEGAVATIDVEGRVKEMAERGAPLWVDEQTAGETARQANKELSERLLKNKEPLSIALQELAGDKRINVAALAAQALAQLGQIKPLCDQFRDVQYKLSWRPNHVFLRHLVQSSPANAEMVHQQLDEHFPSESAAIYRLLYGYTKEQFADEGRQLIKGLESESSLHRVLAYQTLVDLVGPRGGKYQPDEPPAERAKHITTWIEAFESGKLKIREPAEAK